MKRFLTVFPYAENVHLIKDVGMIPYILQRELNYESTLVCYNNGEYDYLKSEVKGLKMVHLKKVFNIPLLDVAFFLICHAKHYHVMQVYHLLRKSLVWCYLFKMVTFGKGKTYLKLDADDHIVNYSPSKTVKYLLKKIDVVSVENKSYFKDLNRNMSLGRRVSYIPNGFYDNGIFRRLDFNEKQNKMVTVGRIGSYQKATEVLCDAFELFCHQKHDWRLEIIGQISDDFKLAIDRRFIKNPLMKDMVTIVGPVVDRVTLERHYRTAKIFVLSSRYEGFPMVLAEAASFGCCIISTNLPAARDITDNEQTGRLFDVDDHRSLSQIMTNITSEREKLMSMGMEIQAHAYRYFYWPEICRTIDQMLWSR